MRFCPHCGTRLQFGSISCSRCGYYAFCRDKDGFLDSVKCLLAKEKDEDRVRIVRDKVPAKVINIDIGRGILTLECKHSKFDDGDVVGYVVQQNLIEPLGVVISGGKLLTVSLYNIRRKLSEHDRILLCEAENLIGYDLQLDLIRRIKDKKLNKLEEKAVSCIFDELNLQQLESVKLLDTKDVKKGYPLDDSQIKAVEAILGLKDNEIVLIIGPPGTGKTRVIAKAAFELAKKGERILIASHTNRAVDNAIINLPVEAALRIGRPEKILQSVKQYLLSYKAKTALGSKFTEIEEEISELRKTIKGFYEMRNEWIKTGYRDKYEHSMSNLKERQSKLKELCKERDFMLMAEIERLISEVRIVGSTLIRSQLLPLKERTFDTILIDECSQASITLALLGMVKARKWVLIGDHKQLLPIFSSTREDKGNDREISRRLSAFCYMLDKYQERALWLKWHYRSNNEIIEFSQKYFYDGRIKPVESCKEIRLDIRRCPPNMEYLNPYHPVVFLDVKGTERIIGGSRSNEAEVKLVKRIVNTLKDLGIKSEEIGVITSYRAQRDHIKQLLRDDNDKDVEVDTVDSFQGREKDVIVFSVTSTKNLDFVEDENRLNVAFTRAKKKLIVVGDAESIELHQGLLSKFLSHVREKGGFFRVD